METFAKKAGAANGKVNVLFVGGSNTVLKRGYIDETVNARSAYFDLGQVDNLAIGGTTLGMGLWTVMTLPPAPQYDLIFIEYCINDYGLAKRPEKLTNWRWAYNGLINRFREHSPRARIHPLMFGRKSKRFCPIQQALFREVLEVSTQHRVYPIDVDSYLHGLLPDEKDNAELYDNESHYARPVVTSLIGNYVARIALSTDQRLQLELQQGLPVARSVADTIGHCDHRMFSSLG